MQIQAIRSYNGVKRNNTSFTSAAGEIKPLARTAEINNHSLLDLLPKIPLLTRRELSQSELKEAMEDARIEAERMGDFFHIN